MRSLKKGGYGTEKSTLKLKRDPDLSKELVELFQRLARAETLDDLCDTPIEILNAFTVASIKRDVLVEAFTYGAIYYAGTTISLNNQHKENYLVTLTSAAKHVLAVTGNEDSFTPQ